MATTIDATFLVIGGGIAGISCVETLQFMCPDEPIVLITESPLIKTVTNLVALAKSLTKFNIAEKLATDQLTGNVRVLIDRMKEVDSASRLVHTVNGLRITYRSMCICTGARPKLIEQAKHIAQVVGIRDTESVLDFQTRVKQSKRIAIVGNGGIASEVVYELRNIHVDWIIKDRFVSQTFVDPGAAEFFRSRVFSKESVDSPVETVTKPVKRMRYAVTGSAAGSSDHGAALGPDWHRHLDLSGKESTLPESVQLHTACEVAIVESTADSEHPLRIALSNGKIIPCDLLVSATGVHPRIDFQLDRPFEISPDDGGILVDEQQRTSLPEIYAAGDVCTANWPPADHWFQMRLWTQARQMGAMAGKSMAAALANEPVHQDFCFELFGHVTQLFGHQVVLLGRFNGQGLGNDYEALIRTTPDQEYIKYVLKDGRVHGAILIGDTGLEETTENLILNQLDVSVYGDDLLNADIDIEDYFD